MDNIQSYLIKPLSKWTDWSDVSEALHGISKRILKAQGADVGDVYLRLAAALNGKAVVSDGPYFDTYWRDRLVTRYPKNSPTTPLPFEFKIVDLDTLWSAPPSLDSLGCQERGADSV